MNKSVSKALQFLDLFTEETPELSLKEISVITGIPKSTAYRILTTLEYGNYLEKIKDNEHDSRYRLGLKLLELGQLVSEQLELREIALPYMEKLVAEINEAVHLVIRRDNKAIYIEKVDSTRALRLYTRVGKSSPLYMGSGPKLLLAFLTKEKQHAIVKDSNLDQKKLLAELEEIRRTGQSYSVGEQDQDTTGISFPIYNFQHKVVAALTVSGLSSYFQGGNLKKIKKQTKQTSMEISEKLGFRLIQHTEGM